MYQFHKRNYNRPQNIPDSRVFVNFVTGGSLQPSPVPQDETAALNGDQFDQVRSFHQNLNSIVEPIFIWWYNDIMLIPHLLEMNKKNCQFLWNSHHISTPLHSPTITTAPELVLEVNIFPQQSWQSHESLRIVICLLWRCPLTVNRLAGQVIFQSAHRITQVEILKMLLAGKSENSIWQESARRLLPPSLKMKIKMMITMQWFIDKSENLIWRESAIRLLPPSLPVLPTYRTKKWTSPTTKVSLPGFPFDFVAFHNDDNFKNYVCI